MSESVHGTPNIGVYFFENIPDKLVNDCKRELECENLDLQVQKIPMRPFACLEWAIPTAICVYLFKPYFESFLQEAGRDHYQILKKWLKKISSNTRGIKVVKLTAKGSKDKQEKGNSQSKVFSIKVQTKDGNYIKFLFDEKLDSEDWNIGIEKILELLEKYYDKGENDELNIQIKKNETEKTIYAILKNQGEVEWEFLNMKNIILEERKREENN